MSIYYATADKSRLVSEDDPDARYVVNPETPGEFADLLKAHHEDLRARAQAGADERDRAAQAKAQEPAEDKAQKAPARKK